MLVKTSILYYYKNMVSLSSAEVVNEEEAGLGF